MPWAGDVGAQATIGAWFGGQGDPESDRCTGILGRLRAGCAVGKDASGGCAYCVYNTLMSAHIAGGSAMVEFACTRCGMVRAIPNEGRAWEIAVIHVHGMCLNTPIDSWSLDDYAVRFADGLPQVRLHGEPWITLRRTNGKICERLARRKPRRPYRRRDTDGDERTRLLREAVHSRT